MAYVTVAEAAKKVRTALKAAGIPARSVSVRSESYSMGSSIRVEINDPTISPKLVESIASEQEKVSRCPYSGEILNGGNRFVFVDIGRKAVEAKIARDAELIEGLVAAATEANKQQGGWATFGEFAVLRDRYDLLLSRRSNLQDRLGLNTYALAESIARSLIALNGR